MTTARYGVELEGPHKGLRTLVLLSARHHRLQLVRRLAEQHQRVVDHVWVECQPGERYDWPQVSLLVGAGYKVTAQVRDDSDLPPTGLQVALVWLVPHGYRQAAAASHFVAVRGEQLFTGAESALDYRPFNPAQFELDEVWPCE